MMAPAIAEMIVLTAEPIDEITAPLRPWKVYVSGTIDGSTQTQGRTHHDRTNLICDRYGWYEARLE